MKKNVGKMDKVIRILLAIILVCLNLFNVVTGSYSWLLSLFAVILVTTTLVGYCPLYTLLGFNTCKTHKH